jgi:RNA ligase (TIGR02306 family)
MANSTHRVEIVPIQLEKHPNADTLSIVRIFDHYTAVVRTDDWKDKTIGAYIPPDSIVPDTPEYSFLKGSTRIRAKKLRGIQSQGLLMPAPEGAQIGEDVAELMGIKHYEPPIEFNMGDAEADPPIPGEHYDIDSWFRYGKLIPDGTEVEITEKIHGSNFRVTYQEGRLWVGSRNNYRKESDSSLYWQAVKFNPWIEAVAKAHPGKVFYAEVFGRVQNLHYGATKSTPHMLRVFDIYHAGRFLTKDDRHRILTEHGCLKDVHAPVLYVGPSNEEVIMKYLSGPSTIPGADHYREGIVIKPTTEMWCPEIGRLVLKAVSPEYLEKN